MELTKIVLHGRFEQDQLSYKDNVTSLKFQFITEN